MPRGLPGGDPSFLLVPPNEQFRNNYVFLTPDLYRFDFIRIIAPQRAAMQFDGRPLSDLGCATTALATVGTLETQYVVHTCQLGFPIIDPNPDAEDPFRDGVQNDGVHTLSSDRKVGVLVNGFDRNVSYAYAAGTELNEILTR